MAHAYTPGLKVTEHAFIRKARRLPLAGQVLASVGQAVRSTDVVARAELPGKVYPVNVGSRLNALPEDVPSLMLRKEGEAIGHGEPLAQSAGIFGWFRSVVRSPVGGFVESVSQHTGQVMLREAPIPVEVDAYVDGTVVEVIPSEGVTVECHGAIVQGIFGLSGEAHGSLVVVATGDEVLRAEAIKPEHRGAVVVGGSLLEQRAFEAAREAGVAAVVVGGMHYRDIRQILGSELGVAITGHEKLGTTIVVTEGFGRIAMARGTHALFQRLEGRWAAANGSTQIRAGVIRPEVLVPSEGAPPPAEAGAAESGISEGSTIRVIRAPWFGKLATVVALPVELAPMPSETMVRVLRVRFEDGREVVLPRSNVERIEDR